MATRAMKRRILEMPGDLAESRLQARAVFLNLILKLRPHVVSDLWEAAFGEFKLVVLKHFYKEIFGDLECDLGDYFKSKYEESLKAPHACPDFIVDRLQQKLAQGDAGTQPDLVREAFRFWISLRGKETSTLRQKIRGWSKRWNLDADWCRDHALNVLREWLLSDSLKWLHIFPHSQGPLQTSGWSLAIHEVEFDVVFSRLLVDQELYGLGKDPEPFKFRRSNDWPDLTFEIAWNATKESEVQFKKRANVNFRMALNRIDLARLRPLAEDETKRDELTTREFEKELAWRNGILEQFERELQDYTRRMIALKEEAKSKQGVVEVLPYLPGTEVLQWLVLYQIPQVDKGCLSYSQIAKGKSYSSIHTRKCVEKTASLVGLALRDRYMHSGRPCGTGKPNPHRATR